MTPEQIIEMLIDDVAHGEYRSSAHAVAVLMVWLKTNRTALSLSEQERLFSGAYDLLENAALKFPVSLP